MKASVRKYTKQRLGMKANAILVAMLAMVWVGSAQETTEEKPLTIVEGSHISIGAKMGYSNLMVNSENHKRSTGGMTIGAEVDYTHYVTEHVGLRIGVDIATSFCNYQLGGYTTQDNEPLQVWTNMERGESMTVETTYRTTTEKVTANYTYTAVGIPVQLAFQGEHWYGNAGVKFSIPTKLRESTNYGESLSECVTIGYNEVSIPATTLSDQHIESIPYDASERGNTFKPFFVSSLIEAGYRVGSPRGDALEIGVFAEMAFNECHIANQQSLVARENGELKVYPTLKSNAVKSLRLYNVGLKIQYDISFRKPRKK